jgi:galactokinase
MSAEGFKERFGRDPGMRFEVPGRTELGGNHTDHQHGLVIASPVDLKIRADVGRREDRKAVVYSEDFGQFEVDLSDLEPKAAEFGTPQSLVRGVAAGFERRELYGFDAYISSEIPAGYGLSSSAAFEILIGRIIAGINGIEPARYELARIGKRAENLFFGKPCGLMDQMACESDGIVTIDFKDPEDPKVSPVDMSFLAHGYNVCLIKVGAGHEDMTDEYASITAEIASICGFFGAEVLRDVPREKFFRNVRKLRESCGDRAVLRAVHVFDENRRVLEMTAALAAGDMDGYLELVRASGRSSRELLQNITPQGAVRHQDMAFALAFAERTLCGEGAVRVHGGGFAGTIQAYVPLDMQRSFASSMDSLLGEGSCIYLNI